MMEIDSSIRAKWHGGKRKLSDITAIVMHFLDFLAKHLAYLYDFTFLRIIIRLLLGIFRYLCKRRINN